MVQEREWREREEKRVPSELLLLIRGLKSPPKLFVNYEIVEGDNMAILNLISTEPQGAAMQVLSANPEN